jgi:alpha-D-glucose phosphate-specific phosphoglucomutase
MANIVFGTDGWRGIMDKEFTLSNVKIVAQAVADYMKAHDLEYRGVIVGYDTRKLSHRFAHGVCEVMLGNGIPTYITDRDVPTPVTAFEVLQRKAGGAVMITASHNPPAWNGVKYIPDYGGPALPETTEEITKNVDRLLRTRIINESTIKNGLRTRLLQVIDARKPYIDFVEEQIDLDAIKEAGLRIICDPMYGTARGYIDHILRNAGCEVKIIHGRVDPKFGGSRPEPLPELLVALKAGVLNIGADLGLATDGDADRLAIYDSHGTYFGANQILPMLFDYLIKSGDLGGVVRTVATTHLVDRIAEKHGLPVYEVPVGFKYVGRYLREKEVVIGGEESGGIGLKGHIPEKDGIFTGIKVTEMRSKTKKSLAKLFSELQSEYGSCVNGRSEVNCLEELKEVVMEKLSSDIPEKIAGTHVSKIIKLDGLKLILKDGGWLLIRPSGTEPVIRIYGESTNRKKLNEILKQGKNLVATAISEQSSRLR